MVCAGGSVDGAASATAHMVFVEEDQAFDAANALVGGGIGCATAGVLDSAFNRVFRTADDVSINRGGCNSFPAGTQVLMADGSRVPIDQIDPGDQVLAFDEDTGEWNARTVLDQWSHLDTGEMVTVTLADGSSVSATDHHLFWVASDQQWVEAENLEAGDVLVDPDGPVEVADVSYWPEGPNTVWELTIDVDHTFTVHTGTADVVVHNVSCYTSLSPSGYLHGATDGGPGKWGLDQATGTAGLAFQELVTGAPRGTGYLVPSITLKKNPERAFDGFDSARDVLLDAKDWRGVVFPNQFWEDVQIRLGILD